jgi:hypothetical protein
VRNGARCAGRQNAPRRGRPGPKRNSRLLDAPSCCSHVRRAPRIKRGASRACEQGRSSCTWARGVAWGWAWDLVRPLSARLLH